MKQFNYDELPFEEIARQYSRGVSWRELARDYGCPDHKTLASHVKRRYPIDMRNQAQSQRARREREGTSRNNKTKRVGWRPSTSDGE